MKTEKKNETKFQQHTQRVQHNRNVGGTRRGFHPEDFTDGACLLLYESNDPSILLTISLRSKIKISKVFVTEF